MVAWSVYATYQYLVDLDGLDPLPFDGQLVNTDGVFDLGTDEVNITVSGYYYIHINVGAINQMPVDVTLIKNEAEPQANIYRTSTIHNYVDTLGRAILLQLVVGDTLRLVAAANTGVYSDADRQTSFTGFLLKES